MSAWEIIIVVVSTETKVISKVILNLVVLTRKRLQCSMDRMEKSAHAGLVALASDLWMTSDPGWPDRGQVALAVSDLSFCVVYILSLAVPAKPVRLAY